MPLSDKLGYFAGWARLKWFKASKELAVAYCGFGRDASLTAVLPDQASRVRYFRDVFIVFKNKLQCSDSDICHNMRCPAKRVGVNKSEA